MNFAKKISSSGLWCNINCVRHVFFKKTVRSVLNPSNYDMGNSLKSNTACTINTSPVINNTRQYSKKIASQELPKDKPKMSKSYFRQMLDDRKHEAERSVLLELSKKNNIPYACTLCEKFGTIASVYSFNGENDNSYLLVEFSDKQSSKNLLQCCQCRNIADAFPVFSRLIKMNEVLCSGVSSAQVNIVEDNLPEFSLKKVTNLSDIMEGIYTAEKLSELNTRLRYFFCTLIKESISGLFPHADVLPFGSSVNGIGRHGCDLDVMVRLYPEEIQNENELYFLSKTCVGDIRTLQQKAIFCLGDYIRTFFPGISAVQKIIHARMPIIKLRHKILKMDCDVSINNMSAIFMSEIIHFCGEIDPRFRPLLYSLKKWAKDAGITYDTPGTWITNYGLTMLVIFFLQNRPQPILPCLIDVFEISGSEDFNFRLNYLKSLDELKEVASVNKESLAVLVKEFFEFMGSYPFEDFIISLMLGKGKPRESGGCPLCVQYPIEEGLNVTKNVSDYEFLELREKARVSAKYLENNMNQLNHKLKDFNFAFGVTKTRQDASKMKTIDLDSIVGENKSPKKKAKRRL